MDRVVNKPLVRDSCLCTSFMQALGVFIVYVTMYAQRVGERET